MSHVSVSTKDGVATLVLHHPPQNRIGNQMVDELDRALDEIAAGDARAVVLRAEGPDFSFGGDIEPWPGWGPREMRTHFEHYLQTFNRFERLPIPTVAAVRGLCFGAPTSSSPGGRRASGTRSSRSGSSPCSAGSTGSPSGPAARGRCAGR
jgi:enoyl-CoA hydratase/carnithine racemase